MAAGFGLSFALSRRWRDLIEWAAIVGAPFAALQVFLRLWLGAWGIRSGGALATPFEVIPYRDCGRWLRSTRVLRAHRVIMTRWRCSRGCGAGGRAARRGRRDVHPLVCVLLMNALVIPFTPQSTLREPLGMLRFIVGLVAAVIDVGAYRRSTPRAQLCAVLDRHTRVGVHERDSIADLAGRCADLYPALRLNL